MEFEVSRKDVLLDNDRFSRFMRLAMDAPNTLSHFFSEVRLYLEKTGEIIAEYNPAGVTLYHMSFKVRHWSPSDTAPAKVLHAYEKARRKTESGGEIYDIFSGQRIDTNQKETWFDERLRAKTKACERNTLDDSLSLHPVTRHIMTMLDNLGIANFANVKNDGTTTITFQIDDSVAHPEIIGSKPATEKKQ